MVPVGNDLVNAGVAVVDIKGPEDTGKVILGLIFMFLLLRGIIRNASTRAAFSCCGSHALIPSGVSVIVPRSYRADKAILAYKASGKLRVTWASVSSVYRDGVERYLAEQWTPLVGDAYPDALPIAVNSPWS